MMTQKPFRRVYRMLQHVMVLEAVSVMTASTSEVAGIRAGGADFETRTLSSEELRQFIDRGEAPYTETFAARLNESRLDCVGAIAGGRLLSFAFFHEGSAEWEMNYGRTPATATRIALNPDAAFVFHAFTAAESRGRGLMAAVLKCGASFLLGSRGVQSLVTTTEAVNDAARAAFRRAGFKDAGTYWRYGVGNKVFGRYPRVVPPIIAYDPR